MSSCARPRVLLGPLDQAGPDRIVLDEPDLFEAARVVQQARLEAALPKVACQALLLVEILGISHMEGIEALGESPGEPRHADKVDVVRHQAISPDVNLITIGILLCQGEIILVIGRLFEDALSVVPSLGHLVGITDDGRAGKPGHCLVTEPR